MTKEELEKEAREYRESKRHKSFRADVGTVQINYESYLNNLQEAYLAGAEPREKQIQIDAEQIRALQKQNGELTDKVRELENKLENIRYYLDNEIPLEFINEATTIIYKMV